MNTKVEVAKEVNPLDIKKKDEKPQEAEALKTIADANSAAGNLEKILNDAPEIDESLLQDIAPPRSVFLIFLKFVLGILVLASLASYLFFTSQLTNTFDYVLEKAELPNVAKELSTTNTQIITHQTEYNLYRFLLIKGYLDEFSFYGDSYIQNYEIANSQTAPTSAKQDASEALMTVDEIITEDFKLLKEEFGHAISTPLVVVLTYAEEPVADDVFEASLIKELSSKMNNIENDGSESAKIDIRNFDHTKRLVSNKQLANMFINTSYEAMADADKYAFLKKASGLIVNDLTAIQKVKDQRIKWSEIMNELDAITVSIDPHYSKDFYDTLGGIRYTSYNFDKKNRQISITGESKRVVDTKNFTLITDLIDAMNSSDFFDGAEMKSFSKSGSLEQGYTSSLRLNLGLESNMFSDKSSDTPVDVSPEMMDDLLMEEMMLE